MPKITVYSTTTCPYCKLLKSYLNEKNIAFMDRLVDTDAKAMEEMTAVSDGFTGVPFTVIEKENGKVAKIEGFDKEQITKALGLSLTEQRNNGITK